MFVSTFLSTFDQDNEDKGLVTERNGCTIVYKVRLKENVSQPPSIRIPLLHNKSYVVKLVEPSAENLGRTRVARPELLDPLGRVKREVDVLLEQQIAHPNLVRIFGCWEEKPPLGFNKYPSYGIVRNEEGLLFILMEYCDLLPLSKWLLTPPNEQKRLHGRILFRQIMAGVSHLHSPQYKVIHRDLKPENIVLASDLATEAVVAKIVDFGFATEKRSKMTSRIGTLWYRSPELRKEGDNRYSESADIYPAGIILCLMTLASSAGHETILRRFDAYMTNKAIADSGPDPTEYEPFDPEDFFVFLKGSLQDVHPELLSLARRMTSGNPEERPTAAGVLETLDSLFPEVKDLKIPYWKYLSEERRRVYAQVSPDGTFHGISPERLAPLTRLTLLNVHLNSSDLLALLPHTPALQFLHVEAKLSDVCADLHPPWPRPEESFSLPSLHTILLREFLEVPAEETEVSAERVESLLLGLPLSQIGDNRMRLQFTLGSRTLVDIDCNSSSFHLEGLCSSRFLGVLSQVSSFQVISLRHMTSSPDVAAIPLETWAPGLALQLQLTSLELQNVSVDLQEGRIFSNFSHLKNLRYSNNGGLQPPLPILNLRHLHRQSLRSLTLSRVTFDLADLDFEEEWNLETLHLTHSRIPPEITKAFDDGCLTVEKSLLLSHCHEDFRPNLALLHGVLQSISFPANLRLHPFNMSPPADPLVAAQVTYYVSAIPEDSPGIRGRQDEENVFRFQPWNPNEDP